MTDPCNELRRWQPQLSDSDVTRALNAMSIDELVAEAERTYRFVTAAQTYLEWVRITAQANWAANELRQWSGGSILEQALNSEDPASALLGVVAAELAHSSRDELFDRLDALRLNMRGQDRDGDEDVVADVMDVLIGNCNAHMRIADP